MPEFKNEFILHNTLPSVASIYYTRHENNAEIGCTDKNVPFGRCYLLVRFWIRHNLSHFVGGMAAQSETMKHGQCFENNQLVYTVRIFLTSFFAPFKKLNFPHSRLQNIYSSSPGIQYNSLVALSCRPNCTRGQI